MKTSERRLIFGSVAILMIALYLIFNYDEVFHYMRLSTGRRIGTLTNVKNDTRYKSKDDLNFVKAKEHEGVEIGDSVYSGPDSYAVVEMKKGGSLTIGENSLVVFRDIHSEKMADLQTGNFRLKVNGTVKVAIDGQVTTLEGQNSEVQLINNGKSKPRVRLLRGKTTVKPSHGKAILLDESRSLASLEEHVAPTPAPAPPPPPAPVVIETPDQLTHPNKISYTWRLYDLYDQKNQELWAKPETPDTAPISLSLGWRKSKRTNHADVEIDTDPKFANPQHIQGQDGVAQVPSAHIGSNYWRVSYDGSHWSYTEAFEVDGVFLKDGAPTAAISSHQVLLLKTLATKKVKLSSTIKPIGYVVEESKSLDFATGETKSFWSQNSVVTLSFFEPGRYFYHFRAVNDKQELTDWSTPVAVNVIAPRAPSTPNLLTKDSMEGFVGDTFAIGYSSDQKNTDIEISDEKGNTVAKFKSNQANYKPLAKGKYQAVAIARNALGQTSSPSAPINILVKDKPVAQVKKPKRKPASSESSLVAKMDSIGEYINQRYRSSLVSVQGFLWTLYSGEQLVNGVQAPIATGIGLRGLHWWDHSGVEGLFNAEVFGLNPTGTQMAMKDAEARYHFRFFTPFPFDWARELQISLFAGFEVYRNTGGDYFSNNYDLMTFGTSLEFPVWRRWSTGGEFVYGRGTDSSIKYEITGHLVYYFVDPWSLGCGYKVHLFQAGSSADAPLGYMPYREGYTELYTTVDYHF